MHAVIFEVQPTPEGIDEYLEIAGTLRSELEKINGFISVERFQNSKIEMYVFFILVMNQVAILWSRISANTPGSLLYWNAL